MFYEIQYVWQLPHAMKGGGGGGGGGGGYVGPIS